jgi:hypothetical protein
MADLREFFHVNLNDFEHGRFPVRDLVAFVKSLMRKPGRSTLLMAIDETAVWTPEMYVMARISDAAELNNYLFIQANQAEDAEPIEVPQPIQRPGEPDVPVQEKPKPEEFASGQEVAAWFGKMNSL